MSILLNSIDHLVLTVSDIDTTCSFYEKVLGMKVTTFGAGRKALRFGNQKINLHQQGRELELKALHTTPGSADLCFITMTPIQSIIDHVKACGIEIIEGPVERNGAVGEIVSIYFRDPDGNLLEVANRT